MMFRPRRLVYALVGAAALWLVTPQAPAFAQDPPAATKKRKKKPRAKKRDRAQEAAAAPKPEPKPTDKGTSGKGAPAPDSSTSIKGRGPDPAGTKGRGPSSAGDAARQAAQDAAQGVNTEIVKEGDTSVKMMQFSGLDIEGRLKSPQLLYFVNRVRAEFDRPRLPHRSFMPEVERSTRQEPLR